MNVPQPRGEPTDSDPARRAASPSLASSSASAPTSAFNASTKPARAAAIASSNRSTTAEEALATAGIRGGKGNRDSGLVPLASPKPAGGFALDALLSAGTIDARQHAAGIAYAVLRFRHDRAKHVHDLSSERWAAVKRDHAVLLTAAGFERFMLDRLCLDDDAPLRCEVGRIGAALDRLCRLLA